MKTAFLILISATLAYTSQVQLKEGITPQRLPPVDISNNIVPSSNYDIEDIRFSGITANVTEYAYKILENIRTLIIRGGLDPLQLSPQYVSLFPVGYMNLTDGWVQDLSTITFSDSVIATYSVDTNILALTLPIEFETLLINYDYHTVITLLSFTGTCDAEISKVKLNLHLGFNFTDFHAFVDKADVKDSGNIIIKFTGLGLLDWIIDAMSDAALLLFHGVILSIVDLFIDKPVDDFVNQLNALIDEILNSTKTTVF
ncbi:hypothetical protein ABEB36_002737 [Hypothenemus hampei]|uniref:Uncharacterized protein n=1 Tax=Hypothenemus hampei TaxID=57062 RepID=A0ABD1F6U9_HYPHA